MPHRPAARRRTGHLTSGRDKHFGQLAWIVRLETGASPPAVRCRNSASAGRQRRADAARARNAKFRFPATGYRTPDTGYRNPLLPQRRVAEEQQVEQVQSRVAPGCLRRSTRWRRKSIRSRFPPVWRERHRSSRRRSARGRRARHQLPAPSTAPGSYRQASPAVRPERGGGKQPPLAAPSGTPCSTSTASTRRAASDPSARSRKQLWRPAPPRQRARSARAVAATGTLDRRAVRCGATSPSSNSPATPLSKFRYFVYGSESPLSCTASRTRGLAKPGIR